MLLTNEQAVKQFQAVKAKMLTNWKVLEDGIITEDSTPTEIFQYAVSIDCELWIRLALTDSLLHWASEHEVDELSKNKMREASEHCDKFFTV